MARLIHTATKYRLLKQVAISHPQCQISHLLNTELALTTQKATAEVKSVVTNVNNKLKQPKINPNKAVKRKDKNQI